MSFDSLPEFFAMGGHAPYVWSSYALTLVVLLANVVVPWRRLRRLARRNGKPGAPR